MLMMRTKQMVADYIAWLCDHKWKAQEISTRRWRSLRGTSCDAQQPITRRLQWRVPHEVAYANFYFVILSSAKVGGCKLCEQIWYVWRKKEIETRRRTRWKEKERDRRRKTTVDMFVVEWFCQMRLYLCTGNDVQHPVNSVEHLKSLLLAHVTTWIPSVIRHFFFSVFFTVTYVAE